jgi:hypothetical protein
MYILKISFLGTEQGANDIESKILHGDSADVVQGY